MKKKRGGRSAALRKREGNRICWAARVIAIIYIVFISIFAFDVFGGDEGIGRILIRFLICLIPSIVLAVILVFAWRCEKIGGALFIVAGIVFTIFFNTYKDIMTFLIISGPVFLVGILFLINAVKLKK